MVTGRDMLRVDGVPSETKKQLQEAAKRLYGKANASLLVRSLIASHLSESEVVASPITAADAGDTVRVELRLPRVALEKVNDLAEGRFSARNYYLTSVILAHLGQPQLHGDEIEVLRRSNYEMAKVGTNLNQIAKAFNTLVKMRGDEKLPEVGKKIASLRREITEHTGKVLRVLEFGTTVWEANGRGQRQRKRK
ncbi:plasmid mobilization relaxosome protein MobC (plasmid) [Verminephrobacter aporrectodeae subsp. tuberculatae]|nr:plasmid mobilization relaxosome protein MobC [Verminephrobacter aporrectodeae subsp. tuberculatae]MCW5291472.1 plasmid mobilization relaxosome protein MobC [Verminephrobacter aporrectodeae subsp. tuberculatae]